VTYLLRKVGHSTVGWVNRICSAYHVRKANAMAILVIGVALALGLLILFLVLESRDERREKALDAELSGEGGEEEEELTTHNHLRED
jgi:hypothetical protein